MHVSQQPIHLTVLMRFQFRLTLTNMDSFAIANEFVSHGDTGRMHVKILPNNGDRLVQNGRCTTRWAVEYVLSNTTTNRLVPQTDERVSQLHNADFNSAALEGIVETNAATVQFTSDAIGVVVMNFLFAKEKDDTLVDYVLDRRKNSAKAISQHDQLCFFLPN